MTNKWRKENIPNESTLFKRVHKENIRDGEPTPGTFRNKEGGMSTDWEKYSKPTETLNRGKVPSDNGVIRMNVGYIRNIPSQSVEHTPDLERNNRAHTDVYGEKDPEVRLKFSRIWKWEIPYNSLILIFPVATFSISLIFNHHAPKFSLDLLVRDCPARFDIIQPFFDLLLHI